MPILSYVNMIYLGDFAAVDTDEANATAESENTLLGLYSNLSVVSVGEHDRDDSGSIEDDDEMGGRLAVDRDFLDYDVGFGNEEYEVDVTMAFNARITLGDGTTIDIVVGVIQTTIGDVFLRDMGNALDNLNIQSVELLSVVTDNYTGFSTQSSVTNSAIVCFLSGTQIETSEGLVAVEHLSADMHVLTADAGLQPILWVGSMPTCDQNPVTIPEGALGAGLPNRALHLSRQHRVVIGSQIAERMFGTPEVLVSAQRFTAASDIAQTTPPPKARYWHILVPCHSVIFAEGAPVESLYPGAQTLMALAASEKRKIRHSLSQYGSPIRSGLFTARHVPPGHAQKSLIRRHLKNDVPFLSETQPTASPSTPSL